MSALNALLTDQRLISILEDYNDPDQLRQSLSQLSEQIKSQDFYISVTGVQGAGKSSLINALLFDEPVLPTDVNETTCIPVEIKFGDHEPMAEVIFKDGKSNTIKAAEETLKPYVHNDDNPGNVKRVSKIIITSQREFLRNRVSVVDLPGVGSLTQANHQTTVDYLDRSTAVLFLLRTVPPITRSDAIFISGVWPKIPTAIFVQNQWSDEGRDEVAEGVQDNLKKLKEIAVHRHLSLSHDLEISVVNVDKAWTGILEQDDSLVQQSGLSHLLTHLTELSEVWPQRVTREVHHRLSAFVTHAQNRLTTALNDCDKSSEEIKEELRKQKSQFRDYQDTIDARLVECRQLVDKSKQELLTVINVWKRESGGTLRNNVRAKVRGGIYDGRALDQMLNDEKRKASMELNEKIQDKLYELEDKLTEFDLPSWSSVKTNKQKSGVEEKTKYENHLPKAAGAIAPLVYFAAASNPVGWIAAGIGLAAMAVFKGVKTVVQSSRAEDAVNVVIPQVNQYIESHCASAQACFDDHFKLVLNQLNQWRELQETSYKQEHQDRRQTSQQSMEDREAMRVEITAKQDYLAVICKKLAEVSS